MNNRTVILDTETTGFDPQTGDRVVEIGLVELVDRRPTGNVFHKYINPERSMPEEAYKVHGLSENFLSDKQKFEEIADELLEFIDGSTVVIHNAPFDLNFLNMELARSGRRAIDSLQIIVVDTLKLSQKQGRTKRHNLNVLCSYYGVDNANRTFHGALLDAQLLGDVYICMTRDQGSFLESNFEESDLDQVVSSGALEGVIVMPVTVTAEELAEHEAYLLQIEKESGGKLAIWSD